MPTNINVATTLISQFLIFIGTGKEGIYKNPTGPLHRLLVFLVSNGNSDHAMFIIAPAILTK